MQNNNHMNNNREIDVEPWMLCEGIQSTEMLTSYLLVSVTGSKQQSLRMRFTATSFKQRAGAGQIHC